MAVANYILSHVWCFFCLISTLFLDCGATNTNARFGISMFNMGLATSASLGITHSRLVGFLMIGVELC